jgi:hypothetical protein
VYPGKRETDNHALIRQRGFGGDLVIVALFWAHPIRTEMACYIISFIIYQYYGTTAAYRTSSPEKSHPLRLLRNLMSGHEKMTTRAIQNKPAAVLSVRVPESFHLETHDGKCSATCGLRYRELARYP